MRIAVLLGGCLLITFAGRTTLGAPTKWWTKLSDKLEQIKQELKEKWERMEANGQKIREKAEAERRRMSAELDRIKELCASKGVNGTTTNGKAVGLVIQETNGFLHFFEQTFNPATNEIEERHFSLNLNDPNAEPTCG